MSRSYITQYLGPSATAEGQQIRGVRDNCGSANGASAPSVLRKSKYSQYPHARNDIRVGDSTRATLTPTQNDTPQAITNTCTTANGESVVGKGNTDSQRRNPLNNELACPLEPSMPVGLGPSGRILSRTTRTSLLLRRWKETFWVQFHPATLLLFDSNGDFERWKAEGGGSVPVDNKTINSHKLVKWAVDFDTMGILKKREKKKHKKEKSKEEKVEGSTGVKEGKEKQVTVAQRVQKYAMEDVHSKTYNRNGVVLHSFKLERWTDVGTSVAAAFASADPQETKALRKVIRSCIQLTSPRSGKGDVRNKKERTSKPGYARSENNTRVTSALSEVTGTTYNNGDESRLAGRERKGGGAVSECGASGISGASTMLYVENQADEDDGRVRLRSRRRRYGRPTPSTLSSF